MNENVIFTDSASLSVERLLPASIDQVWRYLVEPELRQRWFCGGAVGSAPGQKIQLHFDHQRLSKTPAPPGHSNREPAHFEGELIEIDPPNLLIFDWPSDDVSASRVTMHLSEREEGTLLSIKHERIPGADQLLGAAAGWHAHLAVLGAELDPQRSADFWFLHEEAETFYRQQLDGRQQEPMTELKWKTGRGKLGFLKPLLGRWETIDDDTPLGRVHCIRSYEKILSGGFVKLTADWDIGQGNKCTKKLPTTALIAAGPRRSGPSLQTAEPRKEWLQTSLECIRMRRVSRPKCRLDSPVSLFGLRTAS